MTMNEMRMAKEIATTELKAARLAKKRADKEFKDAQRAAISEAVHMIATEGTRANPVPCSTVRAATGLTPAECGWYLSRRGTGGVRQVKQPIRKTYVEVDNYGNIVVGSEITITRHRSAYYAINR